MYEMGHPDYYSIINKDKKALTPILYLNVSCVSFSNLRYFSTILRCHKMFDNHGTIPHLIDYLRWGKNTPIEMKLSLVMILRNLTWTTEIRAKIAAEEHIANVLKKLIKPHIEPALRAQAKALYETLYN